MFIDSSYIPFVRDYTMFRLFLVLLLGLVSLCGMGVALVPTATCPPPPNVTLFDLDSNVERIGTVGTKKLSFNVTRSSKPIFLLVCSHSSPIHWVLDEDLTLGEISEPGASPTSRTFLDFSDPSSYTYQASYYIGLNHPSQDHIFICQPFSDSKSTPTDGCASRTAVLAEIQFTLQGSHPKKLKVEVLSPEEASEVGSPLREFDARVAKQGEGSSTPNGSCPFTLTLALDDRTKALYTQWNSNTSGLENVVFLATAQTFENVNRFQPQLEEKCVELVGVESITNKDKALSYQTHKFFPHAFTFALGKERRTLKTFFDLTADINFYYSWEPVTPEDMIYGKTNPREIYKGQNFTVTCHPSVYLFSQGSQIAWDFPTQGGNPRSISSHLNWSGLVPASHFLGEEDFGDSGGTYETSAWVKFSRDFLMQNDLHEVKLSCACPLWNSPDWVNYTFSVPLKDSELPKIISAEIDTGIDSNVTSTSTPTPTTPITLHELEGTEENFTVSCEAGGTPFPTLEFLLPKNNLDIILSEPEVTENGTLQISLTFPNISSQIVGDYTCLAKSVVGEDRKIFRLSLRSPFLPHFLQIILISGVVVILIFLIISSALLFRLRKEKAQFLYATQEAIRKFQEGFPTTPDLGFKSNSEYKEYEIPINRWGLGNTLLGSGAFGVVQKGVIYYGENRQDVVAVKTVSSPKDVTEFENSLMELTIMSYIGKHEHIVSLVGACTDNMSKRSILIGVEYCANGDLLNYLQKRRALFRSFVDVEEGLLSLDSISGRSSYANFANSGNFTSLDLYKWGYQIANGMDFLTSKKILHADLAARNVLLTKDNICKISDFGLSRQLLMSDNYTKKTNTPLPWRWMAIESLKYRQFSVASDIWSFGVTLFEIFTLGQEPWPGMGWTNEFMDELDRGLRLARPKFATNNLYNKIVLECWSLLPEDRITFAQAREFFETAISTLTSPEGKDDDMLNAVC